MNILSVLKSLDFSKASPDMVRNILSKVDLVATEFIISPQTVIIRARRGPNFYKKEDMTYRPIKLCQDYQRASLPGSTMFYGVISDNQSHLENARAICTLECSTLCKEGLNSKGREAFTLSHWITKEPIRICSFITDITFPNVYNNRLLSVMRQSFIHTHHKEQSSEEIKNIVRFISDEFSKKVYNPIEYLITATIASDVVNQSGIEGIVYPSVQLGGQAGLNIALSPKTVDEKLSFIRTFNQVLYKNKGNSFVRIEEVYENGIWEKANHATDLEVAHIIDLIIYIVYP